MERRIVAQLFDSIDSVTSLETHISEGKADTAMELDNSESMKKEEPRPKIVILLAATNKYVRNGAN